MNLFNRTVTIFNRTDPEDIMETDAWYSTVLDNVRVIETSGTSNDADSLNLHIMLKSLEKPYLTPIEWGKLQDKTTAFTLTQGNDFIVIGDASSESPTEHINFFDYMRENYDGVYKITSVTQYTAIPHLEVGGK